MKILHFLFFVFLSDAAVLVKAKLNIWSAAEGGNASLNCYITLPGSTKFFCKEKCERDEDILIKTDGSTAQSGRYSINYKDGSSDLDKKSGFTRTETEGEAITLGCSNTVYGQRKFFCKNQCKNEGEILIDTSNNKAVSGRYSIEYTAGSLFGLCATITQLTKSDTGRYICGYGNPLSPDSYHSPSLVVIDGSNPPTSTPQATTKTTQTPPTTTAQSPSFTPRISTSSSDCPDSFKSQTLLSEQTSFLLLLLFMNLSTGKYNLCTLIYFKMYSHSCHL
ncbi:uncharacterized protein LOC109198941 isoform X4 [Oreochromis niloticus]|uniref:uncharacterized protein LOC109198941 isoform X4 n=1 Tax=Oreochromis niloticus TaxID=8128 RepID=UPI000DF3F5B3|nr:uncharacterized protein LOC109198941 isoform X4 [Oreochromis niloticus]